MNVNTYPDIVSPANNEIVKTTLQMLLYKMYNTILITNNIYQRKKQKKKTLNF